MNILAGLVCLTISVSVQAAFVWLAAKVVRVECAFKEAAIIAVVCALLLFVPKIGLLLSPVAFFFFFLRWLDADAPQAILAFLAHIFLNLILIGTTYR